MCTYMYIYIYCAVSAVYVSLQCILLFVLIVFIVVVDLVVVYCFNHSLIHSTVEQVGWQINTRKHICNYPIRVFLTVFCKTISGMVSSSPIDRLAGLCSILIRLFPYYYYFLCAYCIIVMHGTAAVARPGRAYHCVP